MVVLKPLDLDGLQAIGVEVELPKTRLIAVAAGNGYIMCGALDIALLNERLAHRGIVAARAVGVRSIDDLLNARIESCTVAAASLGVHPGLSGREALKLMATASAPATA